MLAGPDWSNLTVAGAFVVGAAFGIIVALRVARILADFFKAQKPRDDDAAPKGPDG